jgi:hypothetical protein
MMEWMSRILDGEMAGADEDFGSEVMGKCGWILLIQAQTTNPLSMFLVMGNIILSEPSIIIIWTYQDMME